MNGLNFFWDPSFSDLGTSCGLITHTSDSEEAAIISPKVQLDTEKCLSFSFVSEKMQVTVDYTKTSSVSSTLIQSDNFEGTFQEIGINIPAGGEMRIVFSTQKQSSVKTVQFKSGNCTGYQGNNNY